MIRRTAEPIEIKVLVFSLFGLLSLLRIFLTAGTFHYGFCLALPGLLIFSIFLVRLLPRWFPFLVKESRFYVFAIVGILFILSLRNFFFVSMENYQLKTMRLSGPGGSLWIEPSALGLDLKESLDHLVDHGSENQTLLVLPEGALINFFSRQQNPLYYNLFIPPELNPNGVEEAVVSQIDQYQVDRILVIHRNVWEYGVKGLGIDYGISLMDYLRKHYKEEVSFGPPPYGPAPGGCRIYKRMN